MIVNPYIFGVAVSPHYDGITHYYKCDNALTDSVGGLDITANGGMGYATGKINQALSLDGVNDYGSFPNDSFSFTSSFTYRVWINPDAFSGNKYIFCNYKSSPAVGYGLYLGGSQLYFFISNSGSFVHQLNGGTLSTSTWYHIVITFDDATNDFKIYVNNSLLETYNYATSFTWSSGAISQLGQYNSADYYDGLFDEWAIFDGVAKDSTWVSDDYNGGTGRQYPV